MAIPRVLTFSVAFAVHMTKHRLLKRSVQFQFVSGDVDWTLYVADAPELLVAASSAGTGEWNTVGRQQSAYPRREGQACAVKLANGESNARWEFEYVGLNILPGGRVR